MFARLSLSLSVCTPSFFFFFNDTATTEIYTLSLHDALPISGIYELFIVTEEVRSLILRKAPTGEIRRHATENGDRKSTRLNSSHGYISYAVFCLKKKKTDASRGERSSCLHVRIHDRQRLTRT